MGRGETESSSSAWESGRAGVRCDPNECWAPRQFVIAGHAHGAEPPSGMRDNEFGNPFQSACSVIVRYERGSLHAQRPIFEAASANSNDIKVQSLP